MLPKLSHPTFAHKLLSTGKTIHFRPFTVREEKILLVAKEADTREDILRAYMQIITNCVVEDLDPMQLPFFDIELLFIQLRAKSVNNMVDLIITDSEGVANKATVDLNEVVVPGVKTSTKERVIDLGTDGISLLMRYPTFGQLMELSTLEDLTEEELALRSYIACIESVIQGDAVVETKDVPAQEMAEWFLDLQPPQVKAIREFVENMPRATYKGKYKSGDRDVPFTIEGVESFFE